MHQKKGGLEEIKELRRFYLSEYRKDIAEFMKKSQEYEKYQKVPEKDGDEEKKKFPPILSKANKFRSYLISKEEYFPFLIEQTKKELEDYEIKFESTLSRRIKNCMPFSKYKTLKSELNKKLEMLSDNLKRCNKKYDSLFCKVFDGRLE